MGEAGPGEMGRYKKGRGLRVWGVGSEREPVPLRGAGLMGEGAWPRLGGVVSGLAMCKVGVVRREGVGLNFSGRGLMNGGLIV